MASEPRVTGSTCMTTGIVTLDPGQGHARHNHPGCEENLYILEGIGEQMVETPDGPRHQTGNRRENLSIWKRGNFIPPTMPEQKN